jgi:toxin ParE1/3/4
MAPYILHEKALEDINNVWIYTAENWSTEQADRYYDLILDEIEYVAENFDRARDFEQIRKGYRYSKVKSHIIFFKKIKKNTLEVVRILHERMDIEHRLTD